MFRNLIPVCLSALLLFTSCSLSKQINKQAEQFILKDSALTAAHVGISIYEPATGKYWYNHDADKYFIPASNTKIFTCYAAMKYLGDSLPGLIYVPGDSGVLIQATGDPTFLHPDFPSQPVMDFLKARRKIFYNGSNWREEAWGNGWVWNDYNDDYMPERSPLPVYGNVIRLSLRSTAHATEMYSSLEWKTTPAYFHDSLPAEYFMPLRERAKRAMKDTALRKAYLEEEKFMLKRRLWSNEFELAPSGSKFSQAEIPFVTYGATTAMDILRKELQQERENKGIPVENAVSGYVKGYAFAIIKSRPTDSLLKPMMHRSDNFFAEQALLMVSNEQLDYMNDEAIIGHILKTDFKDIPQQPRWVDGSGLSRYNLFTPQSLVWVLNKIRTEFGMKRIKEIFATGGEGTLNRYYLNLKGNIFAKTGTLSNHCALSGFLITKKGKLLIFSILTGSYPGGATAVRRAVEKFVINLHDKY